MSNKLGSIAILIGFIVVSCSSAKLRTVDININNINFKIEVASTDAEMEKGLMFRKSLGEHEGMIFVYKEYVRNAFWMKNTSIPLSIAFLRDDGVIVDIRNMQPFYENPIAPDYSYIYALEVNQGAFDRAGVKIGDRIQLPPKSTLMQ
jgi:uncharacterized protein